MHLHVTSRHFSEIPSLLVASVFGPRNFSYLLFSLFSIITYSDTLATTLWLPDMKNLLIGKDPDARKD